MLSSSATQLLLKCSQVTWLQLEARSCRITCSAVFNSKKSRALYNLVLLPPEVRLKPHPTLPPRDTNQMDNADLDIPPLSPPRDCPSDSSSDSSLSSSSEDGHDDVGHTDSKLPSPAPGSLSVTVFEDEEEVCLPEHSHSHEGVFEEMEILPGPWMDRMGLMSLRKESYRSQQSWKFSHVKRIENSRRVYEAKLNLSADKIVDVVLKFGYGHDERDELVEEAEFYKHQLAGLQGKVVPVYYGLFGRKYKQEGTTVKRVVTCLVLQNVGKPHSKCLEELSPEQRCAL